MPNSNGWPQPSAEHLAGIAALSQALGAGSTKLCEALVLVFGAADERCSRADRVDRQLQPLVTDLSADAGNLQAKHPN
jgi:hypothetical protein